MDKILLGVLFGLVILNIIVSLTIGFKKTKNNNSFDVTSFLESNKKILKDNNEYLLGIIKEKFDNLNQNLHIIEESNNKFSSKLKDIEINLIKDINEEFKSLNELISKNNIYNINQIKSFLDSYKEEISKRLDKVDLTIKESLDKIQKDNNIKLDEIKGTVNEKLEKTLEDRLNKSFENVFKQINELNKTIGQIETMASDVSSLKNVLANVKTKGIVGEVILGNLIREILAPENYLENAITKKGSNERVEFAVKIPQANSKDILLPIDSKFPTDSYQRILDAIDTANKDDLLLARKELVQKIKSFAQDIKTKYIDEPNTTNFGIMFLPIEGLYSEVINMNLFEEIEKKYNVIICGPSTFSALLNALQIGFKSLVIQKKSAEVFHLLQSVKTEFNKFADSLEKTQAKYEAAGKELDDLVGVRTRQLVRKLDKVESLEFEDKNAKID
jgi:DNA recombination protein RmuC